MYLNRYVPLGVSNIMETWFIALLIKPFVAFVILFSAAVISAALLKRMPEGRLKKILSFSWRV